MRWRKATSRQVCATIALAFVLDEALCLKKGPRKGPLCSGGERTYPLKRSGGLVTSKLAVNLLVADAPLRQ